MEAGAARKGDSTSANEENNRRSRGKEGGPSLNSLAIMRKATTPTNISSIDIKDWRRVVYEGVLLENNTQAKSHFPFNSIYLSISNKCKMCGQKFWVDEKLHKNCFLVLPKGFHISSVENEDIWTWITVKGSCFGGPVDIAVPILLRQSWLTMDGNFKTNALSPNTTYEVAFVVKLSRTDNGWPLPVNLELELPDGTKQIRTENLERKPKEEWIKLHAGEFMMGPKTVGKITFELHEKCQIYKSGLIVWGVVIHPKEQSLTTLMPWSTSSCS